MNMFEDHQIARNELDQLNNRDDDEILLRRGSNFQDNSRILRFNRFSLKLKLLITFLIKNYVKILGTLFLLFFLLCFTEVIQNHNPVVFYLEKGADYVENYFNRIDQIFVNIKSSSSHNSFRRLSDALFTNILEDDENVDEDKDNTSMKELISQDNNNIDNSENSDEDGKNFDFKYYKLYEFIKNITNIEYKGKWEYLKTNINSFKNTEGIADLEIVKNFSYYSNKNYISNIDTTKSLYVYLNLKDGKYRDMILISNFSLSFPQNFSDKFYTENDEKILLSNQNITLSYFFQEILETPIEYNCNKATVDLEFIRHPKIYKKDFEKIIFMEYSKLNLRIRDDSCNFAVDLTLEADKEEDYADRIWNYSLIITAVSILEIIYIVKLIHEVAENNQIGKNLCLITISINIIWNAFMCTAHFYMSMINEETSYEYGTPSMTFFLLFSFFELRLLFFAWKSRYTHLIYQNHIIEYRKKLLRFYSFFYFFLFFSLLFMRYFFSNFLISLIFFSTTWIFQIAHSTINGTKPPSSMFYVFAITLGKLFPPLYLKACPYNIFELEPEYGKMLIITLVIMIQVGILAIQKHISPKFLLPKFLKKQPFNFYKELNEQDILNNKLNNECIICLDLLLRTNEEIFNQENNNNSYNNHRSIHFSFNKIVNKLRLWIESLKYAHSKKSFMVTPCNHAFHTPCFERWIEMKNECPYCRRAIPPLE